MLYSLLRESKVVVEYDGRAYHFDALANFDASTSYTEYKSLRKTIHSKTNYADSYVTAQNPTSISLAVNLSSTLIESNFFDWMGFERSGRVLALPKVSQTEPIYINVYIINESGICLYFERCFVSAVDFSLDNSIPILNVGIESGKFSEVTTFRDGYSITQGSVLPFSPPEVLHGGLRLPGLKSASLSFQQQCNWRESRSVFDIRKIYNNKKAYISEMNSSATLAFYYIKRQALDEIYSVLPETLAPITIRNKYLDINFPLTRIIKRLDFTDVYSIEFDVIPMPESDPVTITFFGEEKVND